MSGKKPTRTPSKRGRSGISRKRWLEEALEIFERQGLDAVRVEAIAKKIGINKSGFYFHFEDRNDLLKSLLHHWETIEHAPIETLTEITEENALATLRSLAEAVDQQELSRYDTAIRQWGKTDQEVLKSYETRMAIRLHTVRCCFEKLGFSGDDLEMRTRTFVAYVTVEREIYPEVSIEEREKMRALRLYLLTARDTAVNQ